MDVRQIDLAHKARVPIIIYGQCFHLETQRSQSLRNDGKCQIGARDEHTATRQGLKVVNHTVGVVLCHLPDLAGTGIVQGLGGCQTDGYDY